MKDPVYRRRHVVPFAIGVTLLVAYGGRELSPWGPWLAPVVGGWLAGLLIGSWRAGSGAGGYAAGLGGFFFVTANFWWLGMIPAVKRGLRLFPFFALTGLIAGAIGGVTYDLVRRHAANGTDDVVETDQSGGESSGPGSDEVE